VAKAAPDGYTLLAASSDMLVNSTAAFRNLPYEPLRDFVFITQIGTLPLVFAVPAAIPVNDLAEFAAYAEGMPAQQRNKLSYGSWGYGINAHLAGEVLMNHRLKLGAVHAAYRGLAPMSQDLVGGQISAAFGVVPAFAPFAQPPAAKLKVLAVTGSARVSAFPQVKTFSEQGFADEIFQLRLWMALLAPAGTPRPVVDRLHHEVVEIVAGPQFKALLANAGFELLANTPQQARENLERELSIVPHLMRSVGVQAQ
jgi:tripartite-type tricarboxylate transporter receptor subunit TctC